MIKPILILCLLCANVLQAENLFAGFNVKKDWKIKKTSEYSNIKPIYKKGEIGFVTKHTSARSYLRITTEKDLKAGETYDLTFNVKAHGQGQLSVAYAASLPKGKVQVLGLRSNFNADPQWKTYKCTFTVPKKKESGAAANFIVGIGEFKGKFNLKQLKLVKSTHTGKLSKNGLIQEVK